MGTLGGHRGNFTWALNKYNSTDDPLVREDFARKLAQYLANAHADGFKAEDVTQGQSYPADEVKKFVETVAAVELPEMSEEAVNAQLAAKIDTSNVIQLGVGPEAVYAYGYACLPNRLKIGMTTSNCVQRIVQQINESTPDRPVLHLEIKTGKAAVLERTLHSVLESRGKKLTGGGYEWFLTTPSEVIEIYDFIMKGVGEVLRGRTTPDFADAHPG